MKKIITPEEMPWEACPQGTIKHLVNDEMGTRVKTVDIYMQFISGGSRSGKHRHFAEEYMFILEGKGYSLHWDSDIELGGGILLEGPGDTDQMGVGGGGFRLHPPQHDSPALQCRP